MAKKAVLDCIQIYNSIFEYSLIETTPMKKNRTQKLTPVAILVRVSTVKQETARQVSELKAVAAAKGWQVVKVAEEAGVSGKADESERHGLHAVEELAKAGLVQKVLVHEVSRVGRRPSIVQGFVERLESYGVSLYWHAQGIETLLPSGKRNPAAGIMLAVLAEMARSETEILKERIASGLAEAKRKGVVLGRPVGSGMDAAKLLAKHKDIVRALRDGQSVRDAAKLTRKGASTVQRVAAALKAS
jgi:DNA invertase Pin-like site-specific DNA recombinase